MNAAMVWSCCGILLGGSLLQAQRPDIQPLLDRGALQEAADALQDHLQKEPADQTAQLALGSTRLLRAVEHLGQNWYRYGQARDSDIPFLRLEVPANHQPEPITYDQFRAVLQQMVDDLRLADEALAQVTDGQVKLPLRLTSIHLDFDRDGKPGAGESLASVIGQFLGPAALGGGPNFQQVEDGVGVPLDAARPGAAVDGRGPQMVIAFDHADALWMRGYTHLLRSMLEFILAYDHEPVWHVSAHYLFPRAEIRHAFIQEEVRRRQQNERDDFFMFEPNVILDAIAAIHLTQFKLQDADRVRRSHEHLKQMVGLSRQMWLAAKAETDDDREWIPNPNQKGVLQVPVNQDMVVAWGDFLDELDAVLDGEKLIPFWRGTNPRRGVNLKRAMLEPGDVDLLLWIHGQGAMEYVELGEVSSEETWRRFQRVFRGEFFGFAMWFN